MYSFAGSFGMIVCNCVNIDMLKDDFLERELGVPTCVSYLPDRLGRPLSLHRL